MTSRYICHRCSDPIEDIGLAMLFWATAAPDHRRVVAWCVAHKAIEPWQQRCDPEKDWTRRGWFDWSAELQWLTGPVKRRTPQVHRILSSYEWEPADALALCALFRVVPPPDLARSGSAPRSAAADPQMEVVQP